MAEHPNEALYRRYLERFSAGDIDAVAPLIADDVVWNEPGGVHALHGKEALLEQMRWVTTNLDIEIVLHDALANDDHVVALIEWHVRAGVRTLTSRQVEIWHVRDATVTERWLYVEDVDAFADFFTWAGSSINGGG